MTTSPETSAAPPRPTRPPPASQDNPDLDTSAAAAAARLARIRAVLDARAQRGGGLPPYREYSNEVPAGARAVIVRLHATPSVAIVVSRPIPNVYGVRVSDRRVRWRWGPKIHLVTAGQILGDATEAEVNQGHPAATGETR